MFMFAGFFNLKQIVYKSDVGKTNYYYKFEDDRFEKYMIFDSIMEDMSRREYVLGDYDCRHFSNDMVQQLNDAGIMAEIVNGVNKAGNGHRWVSVWIEAQTGEFVTLEQNYKKD